MGFHGIALNGFGSTYLVLICGQFLLANGVYMGLVAGIVVVYIGIKENSMDSPSCCSAIIASYFTNIKKINKYNKKYNYLYRSLY